MKIGALAGALLALLAAGAARADEPVRVIVLGTVHLSNTNLDALNVAVDDVFAEKRQAELAEVDAALARFAPTAVALEWPSETVAERYPQYLAGTLEPSRNEVVQIGFRLARTAGVDRVHGIDVEGDFPFDPVIAYAQAHGQTPIIDAAMASLESAVAATQQVVDTQSIGALLAHLNDPGRLAADHGFYRTLLRIGGGAEQPGVALLAAWQKRNLETCARLIQLARPGDRIVVLFGAGHAFLLRQCVSETPGFELVDPLEFLPR
ncbi:MAG: hypothetical protein JNL56_09435 [Alphaproteobacteria bacterium]|nr:hypothetical protein [Alphaproteobacteria bacterium]